MNRREALLGTAAAAVAAVLPKAAPAALPEMTGFYIVSFGVVAGVMSDWAHPGQWTVVGSLAEPDAR